MRPFPQLLDAAAAQAGHRCAGQVLGVRLAALGCRLVGLDPDLREQRRRLLVYVEIDRCATDAISTVTGCRLGRRTLKFVDFGKMAATFVDGAALEACGEAPGVRIAAREDSREAAARYAPGAPSPEEAQLEAYAVMPDDELFTVERVVVPVPAADRPGRPRRRVFCAACGERVNDSREVARPTGGVLCLACAGGAYYRAAPSATPVGVGVFVGD